VTVTAASGGFDPRNQLSRHSERVTNRGHVIPGQRRLSLFCFDEMAINLAPALRVFAFEQPSGRCPRSRILAGLSYVGNALGLEFVIRFF
jgi:hypothetical protein